MALTPEARVKAGIRKWLTKNGFWFYSPVSNGMGVHGIPDFVCVKNGHAVFIEAKAPGKLNNVSELQKIQIAALREAGATVVVIDDPGKLDEILWEFVYE